MKKKILLLVTGCLIALQCVADLAVTVVPGYSFAPNEVPTTDHLNLLGEPTISVTGTLDGSTSLSAGSVNGTLLADSVVDGITIGYNASVPRALQVLAAGIAGPGLTNLNTTTLTINYNPTLTMMVLTNNGLTNQVLTLNTNWAVSYFYVPWNVVTWSTNAPYYGTNGNPWGFTNVTAITNLYYGTNPAATLVATDTVPVLVSQQGNEPQGVSLSVVEKFITTRNLKNIAVLSLSNTNFASANNALITNTAVLNSLVLSDPSGTYGLINPAAPVTLNVGTNMTPVSQALTNIANAINTTPNVPQFLATVSGTNILIYEPQLFYPWNTCTLTPGYSYSAVTNLILGSPNVTLLYTNVALTASPTFTVPFVGGVLAKSGGNAGAQTQVYWNTNQYPEEVLAAGSVAGGSTPGMAYVADVNTNLVLVLATNAANGAMTITNQLLVLPPKYGIYYGANNDGNWSFWASRLPYH